MPAENPRLCHSNGILVERKLCAQQPGDYRNLQFFILEYALCYLLFSRFSSHTSSQKYLVPSLIKHKGDDVSQIVLQQFGKLLGTKGRKEIIINNFKNIFAHIILHEKAGNYPRILLYIAKTTEIELTSFIKMNIQQIRLVIALRILKTFCH